MLDKEKDFVPIHKKSQTLGPLMIKYTPASGSHVQVVSNKAFIPTNFTLKDTEDMNLMEAQLTSQKVILDRGKGKMGLNTSKHAIVEVDPEIINMIVREVMEEAKKKKEKRNSEEDTSMEEDGEGEEGSPKLEKPIKWTQLRDSRATRAVIGEIMKAQQTIDLIGKIDRNNKWWRSTAELKPAREVIKAAGNVIKYRMTGGDEGKGADRWSRLVKLRKGTSIAEQMLVMKARVAWEEACRVPSEEMILLGNEEREIKDLPALCLRAAGIGKVEEIMHTERIKEQRAA